MHIIVVLLVKGFTTFRALEMFDTKVPLLVSFETSFECVAFVAPSHVTNEGLFTSVEPHVLEEVFWLVKVLVAGLIPSQVAACPHRKVDVDILLALLEKEDAIVL